MSGTDEEGKTAIKPNWRCNYAQRTVMFRTTEEALVERGGVGAEVITLVCH